MIIEFGRYKGTEIIELPTKYLLWLTRNVPCSGGFAQEVYGALKLKPPLTQEDKLKMFFTDQHRKDIW